MKKMLNENSTSKTKSKNDKSIKQNLILTHAQVNTTGNISYRDKDPFGVTRGRNYTEHNFNISLIASKDTSVDQNKRNKNIVINTNNKGIALSNLLSKNINSKLNLKLDKGSYSARKTKSKLFIKK
ncbi:MAG: hypothetical protein MJ252_19665 [archaeon]|nr:hypothetical protein [archaeon]